MYLINEYATVMDVLSLNSMINHGSYTKNNLERKKILLFISNFQLCVILKDLYYSTIILVKISHLNYLKNLFPQQPSKYLFRAHFTFYLYRYPS